MATQNIFSIETMKACNGNASADRHYLNWFLQECISQLEGAAKDIAHIVDGQFSFTADTLAFARARLGAVRLHSDALIQCGNWFNSGKSSMAKQFVEAGQATSATVTKAESDFKKLSAWLA